MDGTGELFHPLIEALGSELKVQVVRYPEAQCLGYEELLGYVTGLLPAEEPFVLLGESFSGPLAIKLATSPLRGLCGLILCCTFASKPRPGLAWMRSLLRFVPFRRLPSNLLSWAILGSDATPGLRRQLKEAVRRVHPSVMRARAAEVLAVDVTDSLATLTLPCLYLQASADRLVPASAARRIANLVPAIQVQILDGPHGLLQAAPYRCAEAVLAFVRQLAQEHDLPTLDRTAGLDVEEPRGLAPTIEIQRHETARPSR